MSFFRSTGGSGSSTVNVAIPEATPQTIRFVTGTISSSGDNTVIDISSLSGYSAGERIVISSLRLQNYYYSEGWFYKYFYSYTDVKQVVE